VGGSKPLFHKKRCPLGDGFSCEKTSLENPQIFQTCKIKKYSSAKNGQSGTETILNLILPAAFRSLPRPSSPLKA
jgi:hypothetical protein